MFPAIKEYRNIPYDIIGRDIDRCDIADVSAALPDLHREAAQGARNIRNADPDFFYNFVRVLFSLFCHDTLFIEEHFR